MDFNKNKKIILLFILIILSIVSLVFIINKKEYANYSNNIYSINTNNNVINDDSYIDNQYEDKLNDNLNLDKYNKKDVTNINNKRSKKEKSDAMLSLNSFFKNKKESNNTEVSNEGGLYSLDDINEINDIIEKNNVTQIEALDIYLNNKFNENLAHNNSKKIGENNMYLDGFERFALYDIKMPIEHQKYLYHMCKVRGLDYIKTLAILKHESQFQQNLIHSNKNGTKDYGYMQVNSVNHKNFSEKLNTPNLPLDPYININWGTYELSNLKQRYSSEGLTGRELFESVQSGYNKGVTGFKRHGKAIRYISRTDRELKWLYEKLNL